MSILHGIICPVRYLERFATQSKFHLILPHIVKEYPEYRRFYENRIKEGDFVILDNGIFELDKSMSSEELFEIAHQMSVSEMVVPEVLNDSGSCQKVLNEFLNLYEKRGGKVKLLAVAQGSTFTELFKHFASLNANSMISTLGLPFDFEKIYIQDIFCNYSSLTIKRVLMRNMFVRRLNLLYSFDFVKPVHLMGLADGMELQAYKDIPWIRSNDSSSAFVHGMHLIKYTKRGLPVEKISEKLNFGLHLNSSQILSNEQCECIDHNIKMIKEFCG